MKNSIKSRFKVNDIIFIDSSKSFGIIEDIYNDYYGEHLYKIYYYTEPDLGSGVKLARNQSVNWIDVEARLVSNAEKVLFL